MHETPAGTVSLQSQGLASLLWKFWAMHHWEIYEYKYCEMYRRRRFTAKDQFDNFYVYEEVLLDVEIRILQICLRDST